MLALRGHKVEDAEWICIAMFRQQSNMSRRFSMGTIMLRSSYWILRAERSFALNNGRYARFLPLDMATAARATIWAGGIDSNLLAIMMTTRKRMPQSELSCSGHSVGILIA